MTNSPTLADAIDAIRPAVVQVSLFASDLCPELQQKLGHSWHRDVLGTGFLVGDEGHVVTALHVIEGSQHGHAREIRVCVGLAEPNTENMRGNFHDVGFDVVTADPRHDLALLKLHKNPLEGGLTSMVAINGVATPLSFRPADLNPTRPRDGETVAIAGYPLGTPTMVTTSGAIATSWLWETTEVQQPGAPAGFTMPELTDSYLADVEVSPGNSGGPVFLIDDASVLGVCVAFKGAPVQGPSVVQGLLYSSGLCVVVPAKYVLQLLRQAGAGVRLSA